MTKEDLKVAQTLERSFFDIYMSPDVNLNAKENACRFFLNFIKMFEPDYELIWFSQISLDVLEVKAEFRFGKNNGGIC